MIVLVGESGSGKTTIEKELEKLGFERTISYTSRPKRENEIDGVHYHFISRRKFEKLIGEGFFAEWTCYRGNLYGTAKEDCTSNKVIVIEPEGLRQLKQHPELKITSFYIQVPPLERLNRMIRRGDDRIEAVNRLVHDAQWFQGIEREVDYIVPNKYIDLAVEFILNKIEVD